MNEEKTESMLGRRMEVLPREKFPECHTLWDSNNIEARHHWVTIFHTSPLCANCPTIQGAQNGLGRTDGCGHGSERVLCLVSINVGCVGLTKFSFKPSLADANLGRR